MFGFQSGKGRTYNENDGYYFFKEIVDDSENAKRIHTVLDIREYLLRKHDVLLKKDFYHKEEVFVTAKIVLNIIQSVINTHVSYLMGNPISYNGDPDVVSRINTIYKRGHFNTIDYELVKNLVTFGNAYEYPYLDPRDSKIKSKVIANEDAFPVYDESGNYTHFIEYWRDAISTEEHMIVYYHDRVETYRNERLIDSKINLSGQLPIHYAGVNKSADRFFGDSFVLNLIPIIDEIELMVSRLSDAVPCYERCGHAEWLVK